MVTWYKLISFFPFGEAGISDVLWTEKYSPLHSSEVIGNSSSVIKVHRWGLERSHRSRELYRKSWGQVIFFLDLSFWSWLKKWRLRVDGYDQKEEAERKRPHDDDGLIWNLNLTINSGPVMCSGNTTVPRMCLCCRPLGLWGLPGRRWFWGEDVGAAVHHSADHRASWVGQDGLRIRLRSGARL